MTTPSNKPAPHQSNDKDRSTLESLGDAYRELAPYLNIGYFFLAAIALFAGIGYYIDRSRGGGSFYTVLGAVLGVVTGFYNFIKTVSGAPDKDREK